MQSSKIQTIGLIAGCANLELKLEKFSHIVPDMRNKVWKMIARLLRKHAELTDVRCQPVDTMNDYFKLFPVL
jgi:hypothetical protein